MQDLSRVLGDAVKRARLASHFTQSELAEKIDADERTIANIEHHKGNPKLEILWPLIRTLGIDANTVFYPEQENVSNQLVTLQLLFSQCSEDELELLLPICETIITTYRSTQSKEIKKRK